MKLLVAGNSQAGALRLALREGYLDDEKVIRPDFFVVPGGFGPNLTLKEKMLCVTTFNEKFPPYKVPIDIKGLVDEYDVIIISALGFVDGGFMYPNPITRQGYLPEFIPREGRSVRPLISRSCFSDIVRSALMAHAGFKFLHLLRKEFTGRIIVQPFPYSSTYLMEREDWEVRRCYEDFLGFNRYLFELRDMILRDICDAENVELLEPPELSWASSAFTPREYMRDSDGLHPLPSYGAMVFRQVTKVLTQE